MKILFKAIRQGNMDEVKRILDKKPEAINSTATAPPKKDEGQSPLQVAIKSDHVEVAEYLLDRGADVNFMEDHVYYETDLRAPVLYDAVKQVYLGWHYHLYEEAVPRSEKYFSLVCRLLEMGADPNKEDSCGRAAWNWVLQQYIEHIGEPVGPETLLRENQEKKQVYIVDITSRLLEKLTAYGSDVFYVMSGYGGSMREIVFNLGCNRTILDGITFENEHWDKIHRFQWNQIEPVLRPYYAKESPYYNEESSEKERIQFREKLEQEIKNAKVIDDEWLRKDLEYRKRMGMLSSTYNKRLQKEDEKNGKNKGGKQT